MRKSSITRLTTIAGNADPFTSFDSQAFVRVPASGGFCILALRSCAFRNWFFYEFYNRFDTLPSAQAFSTLLNLLEARANLPDCQRFTVGRRVTSLGPRMAPEKIFLDLADPLSQFVEISPGAWKVTAGPGVLFQTSRSTLSIPAPVASATGPGPRPLAPGPRPLDPGPWDTLRSCLNLPSPSDWLRCLAWLLAALRPSGPFPILILQGPPGSGKSVAARILRSIIDPSTSPLTPIPFNVKDLLTAARHNWVLAFDHVSTFSPPLTDALCRLSTGLGAALPETAARDPETLRQYYRRPVLLTVTGDWSCPAAIAERALIVDLPRLPPECRRTEAGLLTVFEDAQPAILGAFCSAVATALQRLPALNPAAGRFADAFAWAVAASPALGCTEEEMCQALDAPPEPSRFGEHSRSGEPHPMAEAVRTLIEQRRRWTGTATELMELLGPALSCSTPRVVSHHLRTCMLTLADSRIELRFRRLHEGARIIELRQDPGDANFAESPEFASPDLGTSPQPTETEEVSHGNF